MRWFASKADALLKGEKLNPLTQRIRVLVERRLASLMELKHEELVKLTSKASLGVLVNALYTLAQPHDLGGFGCVFHFFNQVIGADEVWRTSEPEPEKPEPVAEPIIVQKMVPFVNRSCEFLFRTTAHSRNFLFGFCNFRMPRFTKFARWK